MLDISNCHLFTRNGNARNRALGCRQKERDFMHKTRRLVDEDSVSFQMFLILLSFVKFCFRKPNFCVQAMSEQYLAVCYCCWFVRGEHAQKPKFGVVFSVKKNFIRHFARFNFSCLSLAFILKYYPILHVVKR